MKIYLIPGLGYNHRIFEKLDLSPYATQIIEWIEPKRKENIVDYAKRMAANIKESDAPIILIGHSFGGIICQEVARLIKIDKIILLSSIKSRAEHPLRLRILRKFSLNKLVTKERMLWSFKFWAKTHGFVTKEEKELFVSMCQEMTTSYLQWAIKTIADWKENPIPPSTQVVQLHGKLDKTFPYRLIQKPKYLIEDGDHIMVYKKSTVISKILKQELVKAVSGGDDR